MENPCPIPEVEARRQGKGTGKQGQYAGARTQGRSKMSAPRKTSVPQKENVKTRLQTQPEPVSVNMNAAGAGDISNGSAGTRVLEAVVDSLVRLVGKLVTLFPADCPNLLYLFLVRILASYPHLVTWTRLPDLRLF